MAQDVRLSLAAATAESGALKTLMDGGTINIYGSNTSYPSITRPADGETTYALATHGPLLATITCSGTPFTQATDQAGHRVKISFTGQNFTTTGLAAAGTGAGSSTPVWFRYLTAGGAKVLDGLAGTSGCDLNLTASTISTGVSVTVTDFTHYIPLGTY